MKPPGRLVIRADASPEIGIGHVMRCLALAQAWQDAGGEAVFVMAMKPPAIEKRLKAEGMYVVEISQPPGTRDDALETLRIAEQENAQWIVVDGYQFDEAYQKEIKKSGRKLLFIDDNGRAGYYSADIVLNQNLHANEALYGDREDYTKLLLGTRFVVLRREFLKWQGWRREIPSVAKKILVTFGGGDHKNIPLIVIRALKEADLNDTEVALIVGPANPKVDRIRSELSHSPLRVRLLDEVNDMPSLMAWADLAISAAGSTCWELAFMGVPSLVIPLAQNQAEIAKELERVGAAVRLLPVELNQNCAVPPRISNLVRSYETRSAIAEKAQKLVDGEGVQRVLMHMRGERLRLRKAWESDCRLLWEWANDPQVRAASFSTDAIPWEDHIAWIKDRLHDPNYAFYVAVDVEGTPMGLIRYEIKGNDAVVSINLDRAFRRQGYGNRLIQMGDEMVFNLHGVKTIHAYVRHGNIASMKAFLRAGFREVESATTARHDVTHMIREKNQES